MEHNAVGWFEIPVTDMDRAIQFYQTVFERELTRANIAGEEMAFFPWVEGKQGASGALVKHESYVPSAKGVTIYFSSSDVSVELSRVIRAGGTILQPKKLITEDIGYMGLLLDSEGNRIALHSRA